MLYTFFTLINLFQIVVLESKTLNYTIKEVPDSECVEHKVLYNETSTLCRNRTVELLYQETNFVNLLKSRNYNGIFTHIKYTASEETGYVKINSQIENSKNKATDGYKEDEVAFDLRKREDAYSKTTPSEYPYSVLLISTFKNGKTTFCTGSLISDEWVLTAAHCIAGIFKDVMVYAGGNSLQELVKNQTENKNLPSTAQGRIAEKIIPHPKYTDIFSPFDIGLVKVSQKFNITDAVKVIKVSNQPWDHHGYVPCVTTAFGKLFIDKNYDDDFSRKTQRLEVKKPCLCSFMIKILSFNNDSPNIYLCAKPRQDYGVCAGDSGGGLVCDDDGEDKIRGINVMVLGFSDIKYCTTDVLSGILGLYTHTCGSKNTLSVMLDTCPLLPWINQYVNLFSEGNISECRDLEATLSAAKSVHWKCHLIVILSVYLMVIFINLSI